MSSAEIFTQSAKQIIDIFFWSFVVIVYWDHFLGVLKIYMSSLMSPNWLKLVSLA